MDASFVSLCQSTSLFLLYFLCLSLLSLPLSPFTYPSLLLSFSSSSFPSMHFFRPILCPLLVLSLSLVFTSCENIVLDEDPTAQESGQDKNDKHDQDGEEPSDANGNVDDNDDDPQKGQVDDAGNDAGNKADGTLADGVFYVHDMPKPCTILKDHIVAAVLNEEGLLADPSDREAYILFLSRVEEKNVTSALHATTPDEANELAADYDEEALTSWRIPTAAEARLLMDLYADGATPGFEKLQGLIRSFSDEVSATPIVLTDNKNNVRYLCDEAQQTYSFYTPILRVAGSATKYHLRFVCTVPVRIR